MRLERRVTLAAVGVLWTLLFATTFSRVALGGPQAGNGQLVGTWRVVVNEGAPGEFFALMVFNRDFTMTERNGEGTSTTASSGVWERLPGNGHYATRFEGFWDINGDGLFERRFLVNITIQVAGGDTLTGVGGFQILSLDGETHLAGPFPIQIEGARMTLNSD